MSETKHSDVITNERTIQRRIWIDSALESVRSRLKAMAEAGASEPSERARPNLYVAYSSEDKRKTGT